MTDADLPAGRALDALVAEKVMGWTVHRIPDYPPNDLRYSECAPNPMANVLSLPTVPHYSTSIADAWTVVESSACEGGHKFSLWEDLDWWYASISGYVEARGATAAEAICRAALRAAQGQTP